jgi:hypothetical protein
VLSREETNTNFIVFGLTRPVLEPTIYALEVSMLTITPLMRLVYKEIKIVNKYGLMKVDALLQAQ